jgi:hypothetical protein
MSHVNCSPACNLDFPVHIQSDFFRTFSNWPKFRDFYFLWVAQFCEPTTNKTTTMATTYAPDELSALQREHFLRALQELHAGQREVEVRMPRRQGKTHLAHTLARALRKVEFPRSTVCVISHGSGKCIPGADFFILDDSNDVTQLPVAENLTRVIRICTQV